jgi:serine protease inhibitor
MVIILPKDIDGISELEAKLPEVDLSEVLKRLIVTEVRVSLPKFKIEDTTDFNDILKQVCVTYIPGSCISRYLVCWSWHCDHV